VGRAASGPSTLPVGGIRHIAGGEDVRVFVRRGAGGHRPFGQHVVISANRSLACPDPSALEQNLPAWSGRWRRGRPQLFDVARRICLPRCDNQAGHPSGRAAKDGWLDEVGLVTTAGEQPGDQRVRVPHVSRKEFITAPGDGRKGGDLFQHTLRANDIRAQASWAVDGFGHVRNAAVPPPPDLVAEEARVTQPREANRALAHHTSICLLVAPDGSHLDHEAVCAQVHFQG
jgi:hypothetical protein